MVDISNGIPGTPYHNLILTGYMGVGKVTVGRLISTKLNVPFIDLETEIQLREGMPSDDIRALYGESRLKALEDESTHELSLRRSSVLSISGPTLLDLASRERLMSSSIVLVLTCALGEILRRLHASQGARFHDPRVRAVALNQVRRERQIHQLAGLETLDTTHFTVEQIADHAIMFWYERETITI
jgi:shikimate kinase